MNKIITIVLIVLLLVTLTAFSISSCTSSLEAVNATPTVQAISPGEVALTMISQKADAEATQMAVGIQFTATAQVVQATQMVEATQAALQATEQARRDAMATDQRARADAAATEQRQRDDAATEQARLDAIGTQSANATATWVVMTMTAIPPHATLTQMAVDQSIQKATNEVELSNLAVKRQQQANTFQALGPYLIAIGLAVTLIVYVLRQSRTKEIRNEETGVVEGLLLDNEQVIRPQLMPGPVMTVGKTISVPLLTDAETQNEVTRRAQAVEALRAMPTQSPAAGQGLLNAVFGETQAVRFQIIDDTSAPPAQLLDANALKSLEQDWKDGQHE